MPHIWIVVDIDQNFVLVDSDRLCSNIVGYEMAFKVIDQICAFRQNI